MTNISYLDHNANDVGQKLTLSSENAKIQPGKHVPDIKTSLSKPRLSAKTLNPEMSQSINTVYPHPPPIGEPPPLSRRQSLSRRSLPSSRLSYSSIKQYPNTQNDVASSTRSLTLRRPLSKTSSTNENFVVTGGTSQINGLNSRLSSRTNVHSLNNNNNNVDLTIEDQFTPRSVEGSRIKLQRKGTYNADEMKRSLAQFNTSNVDNEDLSSKASSVSVVPATVSCT